MQIVICRNIGGYTPVRLSHMLVPILFCAVFLTGCGGGNNSSTSADIAQQNSAPTLSTENGKTEPSSTNAINQPIKTATGDSLINAAGGTTLSPSSIPGAQTFTLTVNGANFASGSIIKWNGTNMTTTYVSPTQLTASINKYYTTLTSYPGTATVFVLNPDGTRAPSATLTITQPVTVPAITSLSPSSIRGANSLTLTVNGSNFVSGSVIKWNGTNMTTTYASSTQLTASINKYYTTLSVYPGSIAISILNPDGGRSANATLTITQPITVPAISSLSPNSLTGGTSFTLTVNGTNFTSGSIIKWNGTNMTTTYVSSTQLTASINRYYTTLSSYPGSIKISVLNPDGGRSADASLTIVQPGSLPDLGVGANLNGKLVFPSSNDWNQRIDTAPVDPNSDTLINSIGRTTHLHPDFGSNPTYGIPYVIVSGNTTKVPVSFDYADESDPGPYPIPANPPIEGGTNATGDRHILVIDRDNWLLYETWSTYPSGSGWHAGSGAIFNLTTGALRPDGWTSADAAGLPIFPGLVRLEEVKNGVINHAIRFTVSRSRKAYVYPARHYASSNTSASLPPMGMRVRLKASVDISGYPHDARVILQAMKTYGMIVADNGSNWYFSGATDSHWDDNQLNTIKQLTGNDFEVVKMGTITGP